METGRPALKKSVFRKELSNFPLFLIFLSMFLLCAGMIRGLETDFGNTFIHNIICESYESFPYHARLYRPIQAQSMEIRPSVLLVPASWGDRFAFSGLAADLSRFGYVVLTIEDFSMGDTDPEPDYETENMIDSGREFLASRSFTDHTRIGIFTTGEGSIRTREGKAREGFSSYVTFLGNDDSPFHNFSSEREILSWFRETIPFENMPENFHPIGFLLPILKLLCSVFLLAAMVPLEEMIRGRFFAAFLPAFLFCAAVGLNAFYLIDIRFGLPFTTFSIPNRLHLPVWGITAISAVLLFIFLRKRSLWLIPFFGGILFFLFRGAYFFAFDAFLLTIILWFYQKAAVKQTGNHLPSVLLSAVCTAFFVSSIFFGL